MSGKPVQDGGGTPREGPPRVSRAWRPEGRRVRAGREVSLCERGIRTFETATRNTLDLAAVAVAKQRTHLPVTRPEQALTPERFQQLMRRLPGVVHAVDRHLWRPEIPAQVAGAR